MKKTMKILYIIVFLFIFLFACNYFYNGYTKAEIKKIANDFVVNVEESDKSKVNYYSSGMDSKEFIKAVSKSTYYLKKSPTDSYKKISYNFDKHYTYEELEEIYRNLNKSDAVKIERIGSTEDSRSMYSIEIGFGDNVIMFDASVHAAEIGNTLFLTKFMTSIVNSYESGEDDIETLLNDNKIIIVPSQNPDGYEMRLFGADSIKDKSSFVVANQDKINFFYYKGNINGVDINRNMPSQHGGLYYTSNDKSSTLSLNPTGSRLSYYPGESLGSEKETQNIIYWMYKYYKVSHAYISLHSCGRSVYNGKPNLSDEFNELSRKYSEVFEDYTEDYDLYDESDEDVGYGNDGTTTDFYSELVSGFKFSKETGRLVSSDYKTKKTTLEYNSGVITIETLPKFTDDLDIIKNEWYKYDLYNVLLDMVKLR